MTIMQSSGLDGYQPRGLLRLIGNQVRQIAREHLRLCLRINSVWKPNIPCGRGVPADAGHQRRSGGV